jgi:hypothetical protein
MTPCTEPVACFAGPSRVAEGQKFLHEDFERVTRSALDPGQEHTRAAKGPVTPLEPLFGTQNAPVYTPIVAG